MARRSKHALIDTLSAILPTTNQTLLLQACLLDGLEGRRAWAAWRGSVNDPKVALAGEPHGGALLPLLYHASQGNETPVDRALMPYLRTAYFQEELRVQRLRSICAEVLSRLNQAGVPTILLLESALAATVYRDWAVRHCHQIDVLMNGDQVGRALDVLAAARCTPSGVRRGVATTLRHASGLPVIVHSSLFDELLGPGELSALWNRSRALTIDGVPARVLAPADALLHLCGWVSSGRNRLALQGTCDIWHVVARSSDLDWRSFIQAVEEYRLALPAYVILRYLVLKLGAPIPNDSLDELRSIAQRTDAFGQDIALRAARSAGGGFGHLLRQTSNWRVRALIVRSMLLPTPAYVWSTQQVRRRWLIPWYYGYRPLRFLARRGRSVLFRSEGSES